MSGEFEEAAARSFVYMGRVCTNGEQYLALDAGLVPAWRDEEQFDELVGLGVEATTINIGDGVAGIVAPDPMINNNGWLEVFQAPGDRIAIVQTIATPYRAALEAALAYPTGTDHVGGVIAVPSGELVLLSSGVALDGPEGDGDSAADRTGHLVLPHAAAGHTPTSWEPVHIGVEVLDGLRITVAPGAYRLRFRWSNTLDKDRAFARWLLTPYPW